MGAKVTFNPVTYEIEVTVAPVGGITELDFKIDVYSDGKEDWLADSDLAKHEFPIRAIGGDPGAGGTFDPTFFVAAPWKILPHDSDHDLVITGNVFREVGSTLTLRMSRAGRTIIIAQVQTFSAGVTAAALTSDDVWNHTKALTVGKFLSLKDR